MSSPPSAARYRVRVLPLEQVLEVELALDSVPRGAALRLQVPTWVPGAYGFMKYGRDLFDLQARDTGTGAPLALTRDGWAGYRVERPPEGVTLTYRASASDPAWGELAGFVSHDQAVLLGTRYLFQCGHAGACRVTYELPPGWALHHPGGALQTGPSTWEYPGYAALLDTAVVMGRFERRSRALGGAVFHHVFLDEAVGFSSLSEPFIDAVMRVAQACQQVFGSFPFDHFTFIYTFNPLTHWGLEHSHGTTVGLGESALIDAAERARAVRLCAHELFHAWNVCRLKPAGLDRLDLSAGSFTDGLWVSEGFTRYYELLLSVRAGELSPEDFFSNVLNYFRQLSAQPAYLRVTPLDSSRSTFLNHNRYPGSVNNSVDYYDHGMLVAFDLDVALRTAGPDGASLDTAFCAFYRAFVDKGFTQGDVRGFFHAQASAAGALIEQEVERAGALSTPERLTRLGFTLKKGLQRYLGVVLEANTGPRIANVLEGSPAGASGLSAGDEILRMNGFPFSLPGLRWMLSHEPAVTLELRRGHRFVTFDLTPGEREQWEALSWDGTPEQLAALRNWLQCPALQWRPGQALSLGSFENFHGIQAVV